ncbi:MAG: PilZ domain-containing protein [Rhodospirillaceae bacterium]|jgi:hypothetical protein|nr:PilZ domain-containing protein [Rhodospirillaceae bacterium]
MRVSGTPPTGGYDKRRFQRFDVNQPTEVRSPRGNFEATLVDISEGGAFVQLDQTGFENNLFVELHAEGSEKLHGRVVREFSGGFALEFDDAERKRALSEIEKFKATVGKMEAF